MHSRLTVEPAYARCTLRMYPWSERTNDCLSIHIKNAHHGRRVAALIVTFALLLACIRIDERAENWIVCQVGYHFV
jgi:hypothetical protein